MALRGDLARIAGPEYVSDEPEMLEKYSRDYSLVQSRKPAVVAWPKDVEEVSAVVKYANERKVAVTPRSSGVAFYGAGIPEQGGIVLDLSRMNRILEIDPRDKRIKIEPGVTWSQLMPEVAKKGLMVGNPLLPHPAKSVVTSAMEREPMLVPKNEYAEVFRTAELVLANGEVFHTGTAVGKTHVGGNHPEHFIPSNRLWMGAQGTLGIVVWANIKAEWAPVKSKVYFLPFDKAEEIAPPIYKLERMNLGQECLAFNKFDLALILANKPADVKALAAVLPNWTVVFVSAAGERFSDEKLAYEEEAMRAVANDVRCKVQQTVGGIPGLDKKMLALLRGTADADNYWKFGYRGACQEVFFHTTLGRVAEFTAAVESVADASGYAANEIGVYVQPLLRTSAAFCQFGFHYDPEDGVDAARIKRLFLAVSEKVVQMGGLFTTPYGPWADMVYSRAGNYATVMKVAKKAFDPNGILNPGKLCF